MNTETVQSQFKALKLHTAAAELQEVLSEHKKAVSLSWISDLLEREIDSRSLSDFSCVIINSTAKKELTTGERHSVQTMR
jgi:hypothetical protein